MGKGRNRVGDRTTTLGIRHQARLAGSEAGQQPAMAIKLRWGCGERGDSAMQCREGRGMGGIRHVRVQAHAATLHRAGGGCWRGVRGGGCLAGGSGAVGSGWLAAATACASGHLARAAGWHAKAGLGCRMPCRCYCCCRCSSVHAAFPLLSVHWHAHRRHAAGKEQLVGAARVELCGSTRMAPQRGPHQLGHAAEVLSIL